MKLTNDQLKQFLDQWQSAESLHEKNFSGENRSMKPIIYEHNGAHHILPANCRFFNMDIQSVNEADLRGHYDLIVIDPPWWNKYVRRSRKFNRENG